MVEHRYDEWNGKIKSDFFLKPAWYRAIYIVHTFRIERQILLPSSRKDRDIHEDTSDTSPHQSPRDAWIGLGSRERKTSLGHGFLLCLCSSSNREIQTRRSATAPNTQQKLQVATNQSEEEMHKMSSNNQMLNIYIDFVNPYWRLI